MAIDARTRQLNVFILSKLLYDSFACMNGFPWVNEMGSLYQPWAIGILAMIKTWGLDGWGADHRLQIAPICKCFSWVNGDERLELRNQHVCNFYMLLPEFISANLLGTRARWGVLEAVPHLPRKSVGILEAPGSEGTSRTWRLW